MNPERWSRIEQIYNLALERGKGERGAFLDEACAGDEELRGEVQSLLDRWEQAKNFLEMPALEVAGRELARIVGEPSPREPVQTGMIGRTISHHRVLEKLGSGGMGVVYKSEDTRLHRLVALKLLPEGLEKDPEALARLRREAQAASALNHPNICTVYDIGEFEGRPWIAMELLEGQTLGNLIGGKPLPADLIIEVALQVADALGAAHAKGIIHRDVKPGNIFIIRRDHPKVLDFGLAKQLPSSPASGVNPDLAETEAVGSERFATLSGTILGTASYMSPEQARGEALDARTDLFSFGTVLYEMATGRQAFPGKTLAVIFDAILNQEPESVGELNPKIPPKLSEIIHKAIEKDPNLRYQTASDLEADLKRLRRDSATRRPTAQRVGTLQSSSGERRAVPGVAGRRRLDWRSRRLWLLGTIAAVLAVGAFGVYFYKPRRFSPIHFRSGDTVLIASFENRTGEPLLDGTIDVALARDLANSRFVNVAARERIDDTLALMRKPANSRVDAALGREICLRDGGIRAMLTGSIEKFGSTYALTADLVDPTSGGVVSSFEQQASSEEGILSAVHRISDRLRQALGEGLSRIRQSDLELEKVTTPSLRSLQLYSQANTEIMEGNYQTAFEFLKQAIAEDPDFASGYILAGYALMNQGEPASEYMPYGRRALELSGHASESERYFIEASYYGWTQQPDRAIAAYEALLRIDPDHYWGANNLMNLYEARGETRQEGDTLVRIAKLRPNSFVAQLNAGYHLATYAENADEARPYLNRANAILSAMSDTDRKRFADEALWLQLYPVYQAWMQDDIALASRELSQVEKSPVARDGSSDPQDFGLFALALGQTRKANTWFQRISSSSLGFSAMLAYAHGDDTALRSFLRRIARLQDPGMFPVSLMTREGFLQEAKAGIDRLRGPSRLAPIVELLDGELLLAQGQTAKGIPLLLQGVRGTRDTAEPVYFLGAESLANAYIRQGNTPAALQVLDAATASRRLVNYRAVFMVGTTFWMRDEMDLARLYRRLGRVQDAKKIESELRKLLAYADPDFPLLVELKRLEKAPAGAPKSK